MVYKWQYVGTWKPCQMETSQAQPRILSMMLLTQTHSEDGTDTRPTTGKYQEIRASRSTSS